MISSITGIFKMAVSIRKQQQPFKAWSESSVPSRLTPSNADCGLCDQTQDFVIWTYSQSVTKKFQCEFRVYWRSISVLYL